MKKGILYMLFIVFALAFVHANQKGEGAILHSKVPATTLSVAQVKIECLIPEIDFSIKEIAEYSMSFFSLFKTCDSYETLYLKQSVLERLRLQQTTAIGIRHLKKKLRLLKIFAAFDKGDIHLF